MSNIYTPVILDIVVRFYYLHEDLVPPDVVPKCGNIYEGPLDFSETVKLYGFDALIYYLARSVSYGSDIYFNKRALIDTNNYILIKFENFVNECYKFCVDVCSPYDPYIPPYNSDELENPFDIDKFIKDFNNHFIKFEIREAVLLLECTVNDAHSYIDYVTHVKNYSTNKKYFAGCVNKYLNLMYIFSHYYSLVCPNLASYVVNEVLLMNFVSFDKLHLSILPHNKKLLKTDKISFVTILQ
jgi:methionyl-tRNA synthetase